MGVFRISAYLSSQAVSNQVLSAYTGLTTVFGMGTGGTPQLSPPDTEVIISKKSMLPQNCIEDRLSTKIR